MKHWISRTFTLSALVVIAIGTMVGTSYAAPDAPLPVPPKPPIIIQDLYIKIHLPEKRTDATRKHQFVWQSELQPDKYVLKFKLASGETARYIVPLFHCAADGICSVTLADTGILDKARDGDAIKWHVIAKLDGKKVKSAVRTFIANTVSAPILLQPLNGAQITPPKELEWDSSIENAKYTLIVQDTEGVVIIKRTLPYNLCEEVCKYNPFQTGALEMFTPYVWFVKAKGFNGDKAKSGKLMFTTTGWPVALK